MKKKITPKSAREFLNAVEAAVGDSATGGFVELSKAFERSLTSMRRKTKPWSWPQMSCRL